MSKRQPPSVGAGELVRDGSAYRQSSCVGAGEPLHGKLDRTSAYFRRCKLPPKRFQVIKSEHRKERRGRPVILNEGNYGREVEQRHSSPRATQNGAIYERSLHCVGPPLRDQGVVSRMPFVAPVGRLSPAGLNSRLLHDPRKLRVGHQLGRANSKSIRPESKDRSGLQTYHSSRVDSRPVLKATVAPEHLGRLSRPAVRNAAVDRKNCSRVEPW
jgi:hypothetical protein